NGNIVPVSALDACNGITSPTPEFPSGAYHYVLPIGVTTKYASINCYSGTVSGTTIAQARALACNMKMMFANATAVPTTPAQREAAKRAKPAMAAMTMPDGSRMAM
ncbi:MAG TPA: YHYH protein, partial [Terracidiphilus sp.]|nr:YHYH protein [Terracidiphilus sp.]